jgi:predicted nucleic acid-binding protein
MKTLLNEGEVSIHPLIIGELATGNLKNRTSFINLLNDLPFSDEASHHEVFTFIEEKHTFGLGIGFYDTHILCSAILTNIPLWTNDKKLKKIAEKHHVVF